MVEINQLDGKGGKAIQGTRCSGEKEDAKWDGEGGNKGWSQWKMMGMAKG
jgi:hypothetical protein